MIFIDLKASKGVRLSTMSLSLYILLLGSSMATTIQKDPQGPKDELGIYNLQDLHLPPWFQGDYPTSLKGPKDEPGYPSLSYDSVFDQNGSGDGSGDYEQKDFRKIFNDFVRLPGILEPKGEKAGDGSGDYEQKDFREIFMNNRRLPGTPEPKGEKESTITEAPTTVASTTMADITEDSARRVPPTISTITQAPNSETSSTVAPTILGDTTEEPSRWAPTIRSTNTQAPNSETSSTESSTTKAPTTVAPTILADTTEDPAARDPTTLPTTTQAPNSDTSITGDAVDTSNHANRRIVANSDPHQPLSTNSLLYIILGGAAVTLLLLCVWICLVKCYYRKKKENCDTLENKPVGDTSEKKSVGDTSEKKSVGDTSEKKPVAV